MMPVCISEHCEAQDKRPRLSANPTTSDNTPPGAPSLSNTKASASYEVEGSQLWQELVAQDSWIFLGDSNTYSGGYVAMLDAWLDQIPKPPKLLNLGVSSETASGLSEVDHPFKRPCVHERVDKVLRMLRPSVVFVCYGMNDAIYQPASEENLAAYQKGMLRLAAKVRESGAMLICLTPPIFEPEPLAGQGKLGPTENGRYAYFAPAENYDKALEEQAKWCLANQIAADAVVDIHSLLHREKELRLRDEPSFTYSRDGVHFGAVAHGLIAETVLKTIGAPESLVADYPTNEAIARSTKKLRVLRDAYLSATGKNRPGLPAGLPVWLAEKKVATSKPSD